MKTRHIPHMREIPLGTLPWNLVDTAGATWRWEGKRLTLLVDEIIIAIIDLERRVLLIDVSPPGIQMHQGKLHQATQQP